MDRWKNCKLKENIKLVFGFSTVGDNRVMIFLFWGRDCDWIISLLALLPCDSLSLLLNTGRKKIRLPKCDSIVNLWVVLMSVHKKTWCWGTLAESRYHEMEPHTVAWRILSHFDKWPQPPLPIQRWVFS